MLVGMDDHLWPRAWIVGDGVRIRAAMMAMSPGPSGCGSSPSKMIHAVPVRTATTVSGASSWTRRDHGGLMIERNRNALTRSRPVEKCTQGVHTGSVDEFTWNGEFRLWNILVRACLMGA